MVNKKKKKSIPAGTTFNIELAHLMADEYMRMADRLIKAVPEQQKNGNNASIYIAISSLAFAIEVHFKSILFTCMKGPEDGHNLEELWNSLPKPIQNWLSEVFDENFDTENKKWGVIFSFSPPSAELIADPNFKGLYKVTKVQTPTNTALGMIQGHRIAFQQGRYAYERPPAPNLKRILYNLDGLQLLAWLTRAMAIQLYEDFKLARKTGKIKVSGYQRSVVLDFPENIEKFP